MLDHMLLYSINTQRSGESRFLICNPACIRWDIFIEISGALADEIPFIINVPCVLSTLTFTDKQKSLYSDRLRIRLRILNYQVLTLRAILLFTLCSSVSFASDGDFLPEPRGTLLEHPSRDVTLDTEEISLPRYR